MLYNGKITKLKSVFLGKLHAQQRKISKKKRLVKTTRRDHKYYDTEQLFNMNTGCPFICFCNVFRATFTINFTCTISFSIDRLSCKQLCVAST